MCCDLLELIIDILLSFALCVGPIVPQDLEIIIIIDSPNSRQISNSAFAANLICVVVTR